MESITKDQAGQFVAEFAEDYRNATEQLKEAREGLVAAISDAKVYGYTTGELVKLSGWSRAQVKNIAAYSGATPTEPTGQPVEEAATQ